MLSAEFLISRLRKYGLEIGEQANNGDILAQRIVDLYIMYRGHQDHVCLTFLEASLDEWMRRRFRR